MQAVILAAGLGKRLGKLTQNNTKFMLDICNKKIADFVLEALYKLGIKDIIIVVGYKKENLINYINSKYKNKLNIKYVHNNIFHKTNNIYSFFLAIPHIKEDFILLESDLLFDATILSRVINSSYENIIVVDRYQPGFDGTAVLIYNDLVKEIVPKTLIDFSKIENYYKTLNIYKFSYKFLKNKILPFLEAYIKAYGENHYYEYLLRIFPFLEEGVLKVLQVDDKERWIEIDTPYDLEIAKALFCSDSIEKYFNYVKLYGGYWKTSKIIDFVYITNPFFPTEGLLQEMKAFLPTLVKNYPSSIKIVNNLLLNVFTFPNIYMTIANGASELIKFFIESFKDKKIGVLIPTFEEFLKFPFINYFDVLKYTEHKAGIYRIKLEDNDYFENFIKQNEVIFIVNPNNPLGYFIESYYLANIILKYSDKLFIIDESFIDFYSYRKSILYFMEKLNLNNLFVIKSLGKVWGIPGLRAGVLFTLKPDIIKRYIDFISLWNINSVLELFLQIYPKYHNEFLNSLLKISKLRHEFEIFLTELKIPYFESYTNFITIDLGNTDSLKFCAEAFENLLFLKNLKEKKGLENKNYVRIAIKPKKHMEELYKFLKQTFV